tara:strand:+ start:705 stop:869 length:165 start_codon:yes stop_codon:yes gene_type:complete
MPIPTSESGKYFKMIFHIACKKAANKISKKRVNELILKLNFEKSLFISYEFIYE